MKLKEIREMYPEGTQIVLTEMAGESQMPYGLKGTVKFVDDAGQIHMSWENGSSLALNIHEDTFEKVEAPEKISVILVEPGRYPKLIEIEDTLEAMQSLVEGDIEEYMPFEDEVAIICNDEGKLLNLPLNRTLRDSNGAIYDIVAGTFFLCAAPVDSDCFESLTDEQSQTCLERFAMPERFIKANGDIFVLPYL